MTTTPSRSEDRRIQRTRQLLMQASIELMQEKGFKELNVQEIAERANVSRGTFYAHFTDKYAILETLLQKMFSNMIDPLPPISHWDRQTLQLLIKLLLEHFKNVQRRCHPLGIVDPLIERFFQEELTKLLLSWLKLKRKPEMQGEVPANVMAQTMSRAMLGMALQWSMEPAGMTADQMAHYVLQVLVVGVERLAPEVLL